MRAIGVGIKHTEAVFHGVLFVLLSAVLARSSISFLFVSALVHFVVPSGTAPPGLPAVEWKGVGEGRSWSEEGEG